MLTLEINKSEVERARLVKEAKFPVFLCTAEFGAILQYPATFQRTNPLLPWSLSHGLKCR